MNQSACPGEEQLRAYLLGTLPEDLAEQTERHLQVCRACELTAAGLEVQADSLVEQIREPPSDDPYLAEAQCQVAVAKAKLAAGKSVPEEGQPQDLAPRKPADLGCLGEYQLLALLGRGGMGAVYKARQTKLKKIVALKVLPKERTSDPRAVTRFEREMEAVGQLKHENIVEAHDARDIQGTNVLVMEYVDGKDLAKLVQCFGRLRTADACELVRQTALGLQYAHQHGLVHRDIKPSNLMLTTLPSTACRTRQDGRGAGGEVGGVGIVKILDLGLALLATDQSKGGDPTSTGQALGTADYIAPEQVDNAHSVGPRADIYALGCTLYKLLTGSPPFSGPQYKTDVEKLVGHLKEIPPPVRGLCGDVSAELAAVIERMMAKSPADRFATAAEVAAAIAPFAAGSDLVRVLAEASARDDDTDAMEQSPSATDPFGPSSAIDTDAGGPGRKMKVSQAPPAPEGGFSDPRPRRTGFRSIRPPKVWLAVGGAALFGVVLLGVLIKLQTREGTLIANVNDADAAVEVLNEKDEVQITRKGEKGSVTVGVAPGKGRLRLVKDGVELFTKDFSIVSGGTGTIDARLERKTSPTTAATENDATKAKELQAACAKQLGVPIEITNSIGMKLALIPSGEFQMGSTKEQIDVELRLHGYHDFWRSHLPGEFPQHRVRITKPYRLGVTEVTQEQYQRVMGINPSKFQGDLKRPVEQASWEDAVEFCRKLSNLPAEKVAKRRYELPTEAQWEYACRAGSMVPLQSAADPFDRAKEEQTLGEYAWICANSNEQTHPVGQKRANAFGLYDMYGNVAERCADWYQRDYYAMSPVDDPAGPATGSDRVARGGCWCNPPYGCRLTARVYSPPEFTDPYIGFRVAIVIGEYSRATAPAPVAAPVPTPAQHDQSIDNKKAQEFQVACARRLGVPVETTNSIGMKLVLIPSDEFEMGSTKEQIAAEQRMHGFSNWFSSRLLGEFPQHRVRITKPYRLGATEVTQEQYQRVMGSNPSKFQGDPKRPVEQVPWNDAVEFCRRLSELPEEKAAQRRYGLPTEAQWEYACRARSTLVFQTAADPFERLKEEQTLGEYAWTFENSIEQTHPVGQKRANAFGLYDMYGNAAEWCADWYQPDYYAQSPLEDPRGPATGSDRVTRGGSYYNPVYGCRLTARFGAPPAVRLYAGFRVAQVPADK